MPATADFTGTPASISARLVEQTVAIEEDPLDSSTSTVLRSTYGNSAWVGSTVSRARWARAPWPTSRRLGARRGRASPVEKGGKL